MPVIAEPPSDNHNKEEEACQDSGDDRRDPGGYYQALGPPSCPCYGESTRDQEEHTEHSIMSKDKDDLDNTQHRCSLVVVGIFELLPLFAKLWGS